MAICGIDFGTSNSAIAIVDNSKQVKLVELEKGCATMPSAIFYNQSGIASYGTEAIEEFYMGEEGRLMRSFKRTLGTYLVEYGAIINGKLKPYDHIIAGFLRSIKNTAQKQTGEELESVVMGRPVHFVDGDNKADELAQSQLEKIAHMVGFKNVVFQFEPIAAAFAHERKLTSERLALVADIGGGTSDFTIIRLSPDAANKPDRKEDILASSGIRIGGNDFDFDFCLNNFMPYFGMKSSYGLKNLEVPLAPFHDMSDWSRVNSLYVPKMLKELRAIKLYSHDKKSFGRFVETVELKKGYKILSKVEETKIQLTDKDEEIVDIDFLVDKFQMNLKRTDFENSTAHYIDKIIEYIRECMSRASINSSDINLIILTGGTSAIPLLQKRVKALFPHAEISDDNRLGSVVMGLGYDSLRRF